VCLVSVDLDLVKVAAARDACRNGVGRALRLSAGLSLREVADEVGAGDPSTVLRWERGQRRPRGEMAERYGDLLDRIASRGRGAPETEGGGLKRTRRLN
jgi:transcriptional regulator with XRE-family HTH domain